MTESEKKVSVIKYLELIAEAYAQYLKEKGLYQTIISQDMAAWPVPLQEVVKRIRDEDVKNMRFDKHVEYCKRILRVHTGFDYIHQPLASGADEHIVMIRTDLLKKTLKGIEEG